MIINYNSTSFNRAPSDYQLISNHVKAIHTRSQALGKIMSTSTLGDSFIQLLIRVKFLYLNGVLLGMNLRMNIGKMCGNEIGLRAQNWF